MLAVLFGLFPMLTISLAPVFKNHGASVALSGSAGTTLGGMWRKRNRDKPGATSEQTQAEKIAELTKSRRAIADAYEVERSRIERDLHDGTQQYLVAASIKLGEALLDAPPEVDELIRAAQQDLNDGLDALRKTVHGIHPQVLAERGLVAAVKDMAAGYGPHVLVSAPHPLPQLSPSVLAAGYFFCAEALTNSAKHALGADVSVLLIADKHLHITVVDQGPGGIRLKPGAGLAGMRDRLDAFGGWLEITSPEGGPTSVSARIPLLVDRGQPTFTVGTAASSITYGSKAESSATDGDSTKANTNKQD